MLVLLLELCDRTPQLSVLSPVRRVIGLHHCIQILLTAFVLYNHACYNTEISVKLLTFLFNVYKRFFGIFVTFFNVF